MFGKYKPNKEVVNPWPKSFYNLSRCPDSECGADMMQPLEWAQTPTNRNKWHLLLYCGECLTHYEGEFSDNQIDNFDDFHSEVSDQIYHGAEAIEKKIMQEYVDGFSAALKAGQVYPEDF